MDNTNQTKEMRAVWGDMLLPPSSNKVSQRGNFQPFPNITVVAHLRPPPTPAASHPSSKESMLLALANTLQDIAGDYISPLPFRSYHATLSAGPCAVRSTRQEWKALLRDPCWRNLSQYLSTENYDPKDLRFDESNIVFKNSGGVTLYFSDPLEPVDGKKSPYTGDETAAAIRREIRKLGRKTIDPSGAATCNRKVSCAPEIRNRQFAEHLMERRDRPWHITLAYPRPCGGKMPLSVQHKVKRAVVAAFSEFPQGRITFDPSRLCLSPDMTRFVPWDGLVPAPSTTTTFQETVQVQEGVAHETIDKQKHGRTRNGKEGKIKHTPNTSARNITHEKDTLDTDRLVGDEENNHNKEEAKPDDSTKRIRKIHKLLRQIEELKTKTQDTLNADQLQKLATEATLRQELKHLEQQK